MMKISIQWIASLSFCLFSVVTFAQKEEILFTRKTVAVFDDPDSTSRLLFLIKENEKAKMSVIHKGFAKISYNDKIGYAKFDAANFVTETELFEIIADDKHTDVINVSGKNKNAIYIRAREWFALVFKNANNVIQMDDKDAGIVIGKGGLGSKFTLEEKLKDFSSKLFKANAYSMLLGYNSSWLASVRSKNNKLFSGNFTIKVSIKDDKFKYEVLDISLTQDPNATFNESIPFVQFMKGNEIQRGIAKNAYEQIKEIEMSLVNYILNDKKDDW